MEERLTELYQGVAVHATADREHMAALELLAVVMLAAWMDAGESPIASGLESYPTQVAHVRDASLVGWMPSVNGRSWTLEILDTFSGCPTWTSRSRPQTYRRRRKI